MKKELTTFLLSISITALALSFVYLAVVIDRLNDQAPAMISEVKSLRTSIPSILEEAQQLREDIPIYIEDIVALVANSRETGKQAGEGAVTGVVTGVVKAPFSLVSVLASSLGGSVKLSAKEREVIAVAMSNLLATNQPGVRYPFAHPTSGMKGMLELMAVTPEKELSNYEVRISIMRNNATLLEKDLVIERDSSGEMKLVKSRNSKTTP